MKKVLFLLITLVLVTSCKGSDSELKPNAYFSVSETEKVVFSKGNLQYQASAKKWRFAEKPWDYIGEVNENISPSYSGWIDLFGWGTGNNPTQHGLDEDYEVFNDWGDYCGLPTPEGTTGKWRTLTREEWDYVMFKRTTSSGIRYAKAQVNNINGIIILPDSLMTVTVYLNNPNDDMADFDVNVISALRWERILEPAGCVFLPAACVGYAGDEDDDGESSELPCGNYWSSTPTDLNTDEYAYVLAFQPNGAVEHLFSALVCPDGTWNVYRFQGCSVRLVVTAKENTATKAEVEARAKAELQRKIKNARAQGYVELGLPSGTWWKDKNETGFYTYDEAMEAFGNELPITEQFEELISYCEWTWMGNGNKVVGPSGESIFLPAAGYRNGSDVFSVGSYGYYWSSTPGYSGYAYYLYCGDWSRGSIYHRRQHYGRSVRLVALPQN